MEVSTLGVRLEFSGEEWELMQIVFSHMYENFNFLEDKGGARWRLFGLNFNVEDGGVVNEVLRKLACYGDI